MTLIETIKQQLDTVNGIQAWFGELPRNQRFPTIRYVPLGGDEVGHLRGEGDLRNVLLQIDVYANELSLAWDLAEQARKQVTRAPLFGRLRVAPFSLHEEGLDGERISFQVSLWGSA